MRWELRRIEPLRTANVLAVLYGTFMLIFSLLLLPFFLLAAMIGHFGGAGSGVGAGESSLVGFLILLYPVIGVAAGWITGLLVSVIYNFIIRWTGGLSFEFRDGAGDAATAPPTPAGL